MIAWSVAAVNDAITDSGRTKRSIAEETGIPYPTLNRKLSGKTDFTLSELFLLAEAMQVPPSRFVVSRSALNTHA